MLRNHLPWIVLEQLPCTGQTSTKKNYPAQNSKVLKLWNLVPERGNENHWAQVFVVCGLVYLMHRLCKCESVKSEARVFQLGSLECVEAMFHLYKLGSLLKDECSKRVTFFLICVFSQKSWLQFTHRSEFWHISGMAWNAFFACDVSETQDKHILKSCVYVKSI